ncbi:MAG: hypothetical protein LC114_01730 [Bryobacterales bacterium]|nr:hypothetical protein [Bryobacterales bacterium]
MADLKQQSSKDVLESYRRWKEEGAALRERARNLLIERFHELVREAQQVQQDLQEDFSHAVKFPANPKPAKKGRARTSAKNVAASVRAVPPPAPAPLREPPAMVDRPRRRSSPKQTPPAKPDVEIRETEKLRREVERARQRLAEAKASGSAVRIQNAEDRLYELSDELRLRTAPVE